MIARIHALEAEKRIPSERATLVHQLEVHHIELEAQNRAFREVQTELDASRRRYADLYDFAPVPYVTLAPDATVVEANLTATAILGLERSQVVGNLLYHVAKFDRVDVLLSHLRRAVGAGVPTVDEMRFEAAHAVHEVQIVSTAVPGANGAAPRVRSAFLDVGPLKANERNLERARAAEAHLRHLERAATAHAALTDAVARMEDMEITDVLRVIVEQLREITQAELAAIGFVVEENTPFEPWEQSGVSPEIAAALRRNPRPIGVLAEAVRSERPIRIRDVSQHPAFGGVPEHHPRITSFLGVPIRHGGRTIGTLYAANRIGADEFSEADELLAVVLAQRAAVAVAIARMLGRERQRSHLLESAASTFAGALDVPRAVEAIARLAVPSLADACVVHLCELDGKLRMVAAHHSDAARDAALQKMCGAPSGLATDLVASVVAEKRPQRLAAAPRGGEVIASGATLLVPLRRDGEALGLLQLAFEAGGKRFSEQDVPLAVEFAHEGALAVENARLHETTRRAVASRDELLGVVTHDLGNLLNTLLMSAQLASRAEADPANRGRLDVIAKTVRRMSSVLKALRDATMIEAGHFTVSFEAGALGPLLTEAVAMLRARADEKHVQIELRVPSDLPLVSFDDERIHQVVQNLAVNGIVHAPHGGRVVIEVTRPDGAAFVRLAISDNGSGIAREDMPHLFERYWKKDKRERIGTGLGLFIVKGIVEAHGGAMEVESEVGRGTTFALTLPVARTA